MGGRGRLKNAHKKTEDPSKMSPRLIRGENYELFSDKQTFSTLLLVFAVFKRSGYCLFVFIVYNAFYVVVNKNFRFLCNFFVKVM